MKTMIHMLNVQHGDCIAIVVRALFRRPFTILIDGGKSSYRAAERLIEQDIIPKRRGKYRLDLLVGSHHDLDHLQGLLPLIEDDRYEIGEAWAPVVLKPSFTPWRAVVDHETFTEAAIRDPEAASGAALANIEAAVAEAVRFPRGLETGTVYIRGAGKFQLPPPSRAGVRAPEVAAMEGRLSSYPTISRLLAIGQSVPGVIGCAEPSSPPADSNALLAWADGDPATSRRAPTMARAFGRAYALEERSRGRDLDDETAQEFIMALASATTRAVFNINLVADYIKALRRRGIPIRMPLAAKSERVFIDLRKGCLREDDPRCDLRVELLSPTRELVQQYQEALVMPPEMLELTRAVNYVTVPNKMSYVFNLYAGKAIALFTGDSGFTDFYNSQTRTFDELRLESLRRARWVKVPHHAGHFERFARCYLHLLEGNGDFAAQVFATSLGEGHENPSEEYELFAARLSLSRSPDKQPIFRFTNPPLHERFDEPCPNCPRIGSPGPEYLGFVSTRNGDWQQATAIEAHCCTNLERARMRRIITSRPLWVEDHE